MTRKSMIVIIITSIILAGCWDRLELNDVSVITGLAVDEGENAKYKLSVESVNAAELNSTTAGGNTPSIVYSLEGDAVSELINKMNIVLSNRPIYSHMKLIVIGEKLAKKGDLDFLDFLERNREIREDFNITIARGVSAEDILKVTYPIRKASSLKISHQLDEAVSQWGADPNIRLNKLLNAFSSPARQPVLAVLAIEGESSKGSSVDNMKKVKPDALVKIDGLAVFKDQTLVDYFSIIDTRNYLWTQNDVKRTSVTIACNKDNFFPLDLYNSYSNIQAKMKNGKPYFKLNINSEAGIDGNQCGDPLNQKKTYEKYERLASKQLKESMMKTIEKAQKDLKIDIFGFGEELRRQEYKAYKKLEGNWDEAFAEAEIDVNFNVIIRRSGIRTNKYETK